MLSLHASKCVLAEQIGSPKSHFLADVMINLTLANGKAGKAWNGITSYSLSRDWAGLVIVIENRDTNRLLKETILNVIKAP